METIDDFIGEGKPLADRWREVLNREYVPKSELRRLVEEMEHYDSEGEYDRYAGATYYWADRIKKDILNGGE